MIIFHKLAKKVEISIRHFRECDLTQPCECAIPRDDVYVGPNRDVLKIYSLPTIPKSMPYSVLVKWLGEMPEEPEMMDGGLENWIDALEVLKDQYPKFYDWFNYHREAHAAMKSYNNKLERQHKRPLSVASRVVIRHIRKIVGIENKKRVRVEWQPPQRKKKTEEMKVDEPIVEEDFKDMTVESGNVEEIIVEEKEMRDVESEVGNFEQGDDEIGYVDEDDVEENEVMESSPMIVEKVEETDEEK